MFIVNKFEKAREVLQEINGDAWLIICNEDSDVHSHFMLGVKAHARHYILIDAKGKHQIITVRMEAPMIEKSLKSQKIDASVIAYKDVKDLKSILTKVLDKPKIAVNFGENILDPGGTVYADHVRAGDLVSVQKLVPNTSFFSAAPIINELRAVKSPKELNDLRNTCKVNLEILEEVTYWVKIGMKEKEIAAKLDYEYMKLGKPSFDTIVASGANSADPHHNSSDKKVDSGVLLIDSGLQIDQMCSDITWTFWIGGKPPEDFLQAYNALYEAKKIANNHFIASTPNYLPAKKYREYSANKGYDHEKLFIHGLGHPLGFEVHDVGMRISSNVPEEHVLKENMVYSNEPGLYWPGKWGIRLEDDIIIGKDKCEQLTYNHEDPIII